MSASVENSPQTLIDELLAEQQQLTAVERFARKHEDGALPAQARYYRDLIPLSKPQRGEQYAFAVDLDACTGCKACVSACHSLNGLDEDEIWRNVGVLHGGTAEEPYQQTVTTACHHCVEPACLTGCPVMAYDKDAETGIVRHLDDQCIGCQYCVLKCPYDVPKYSEKRGIVRKCDMCSSRLAVGEAPACVQACPTSAISIRLVDREEVSCAAKPGGQMIPGAFDSGYTKPSTSFRTQRAMPANAHPGDAHALRLEHAHWPLVFMLVLTQMAVGLFLALVFAPENPAAQAALALAGFATLNAGLAVSVLHLGRPLGAWRFFLGLRTSWMSREILAFGVFAGAAGASALTSGAALLAREFPRTLLDPIFTLLAPLAGGFAWIAALLGLGAIYCSAMIYIDTRRTFWRAAQTLPKFLGTTLVLGTNAALAVLAALALMDESPDSTVHTLAAIATLIRSVFFAWEAISFAQALRDPRDADHRSALTVWTFQPRIASARVALFLVATALGVACMAATGFAALACAAVAFVLTITSRIIERHFYFTAVIALRMPGGVVA